MEFEMFDNSDTYERHVFNHEKTYPLLDIWVKPPRNTFWFRTEYDHRDTRYRINGEYLHFHPGGPVMDESLQFDPKMAPVHIERDSMFFDPKKHLIYIRKSILPWSKPMWSKRTKYHGILPKKPLRVNGEIRCDPLKFRIYMILNYFGSRYDDA